MDLKLKDEITKLLIEEPGMSIGQIARKTRNYYSYTHKVISEMEALGLVSVEKARSGKREITLCKVREDYKKRWVQDLKKFLKPMMKDAEIKAAFLLMYLFVAYSLAQQFCEQPVLQAAALSAPESFRDVSVQSTALAGPEPALLIIIPLLVGLWFVRRRK